MKKRTKQNLRRWLPAVVNTLATLVRWLME